MAGKQPCAEGLAAAAQEERIQALRSGQSAAGIKAQNHQRRCHRICHRAGLAKDGDRSGCINQRSAGGGVHRMRQAHAADRQKMTVIARGCCGCVIKCDNGVPAAQRIVGCIYANRPWRAIGSRPNGTNLSIDRTQGMGDGMGQCHFGEAVDTIALGDTAKVKKQRGGLAGQTGDSVDFEGFACLYPRVCLTG